MNIDHETVNSDGWWLKRLMVGISARYERVEELNDWMLGKPPIPAPDNERPGFETLQKIANLNPAELILEARLHRMRLMGAVTKVDSSANGDDVVSRIFEEQQLKTKFYDLFRLSLGHGIGYAMLHGDGQLRIVDSRRANLEKDVSGNTVAGLFMYRDSIAGRDVAILARPGYYRYAYRENPISFLPSPGWSSVFLGGWEWGEIVPTGFDHVPMYEMLPPGGHSLISRHLPTLQRINHGILQRLILISLQAFKQRALKNAPDEDEDGNEIDYSGIFETAPDALWTLPEGVDIWESGNADFNPVLTAVKDDLRFLAVTSKTPLYMISPDDANGSAEGASAQRETLIFDIETLMDAFEGTLKRILSDMLFLRGESERADLSGFKLIWANPRRATISEQAQAATTAKAAGLPMRFVLSKYFEFSPDEVEEALAAMSDDAFLNIAQNVSNSGGGSVG